MIRDWRIRWEREFPFYQVQLPGLNRPNDDWAVLRESQQETLGLPRTGMIVTMDLGQRNKLHPTNKKEYGERLADLVLQNEYGAKISAESPFFHEYLVKDGAIRIRFEGGGSVLKTTDGQPPRSFQIAGSDRVFIDANAMIQDMEVVVSHPRVSQPVAVRYAWADFPDVNLCGENRMPAGPFRTDRWPVQGENETWIDLPVRAGMQQQYAAMDIAEGNSADWAWDGPVPLAEPVGRECLRRHPAGLFMTVKPLWMRRPEEQRPVFSWRTTESSPWSRFDPGKGCTVVLHAEVSEGTDPFHGLDVELVLPRPDGSAMRYRFSVQPLRVYGFTGMESRLMGSDLENTTGQRAYRLAIRPDGGAQLYYGSRALGILPGDVVPEGTDGKALFRWGKFERVHRLDAKISRIEWDLTGAFSPAP